MRRSESRGARRVCIAALAGLAAALSPGAAPAGAATAGDEVRYSAKGERPSVAMRGDGKVVVAWSDDGDILARRFRVDEAAGSVFRVNRTVTGDLAEPQVGMDGNGNFAIVWQGGTPDRMSPAGGDGSGSGIFGQRFRANGERRDGVFRVNQVIAHDQAHPRLGMAPNGNFAVLWEDRVRDAHGNLVNVVRLGAWAANGARLGRPVTLGGGDVANLVGGVGAWDDSYAAGWIEARRCDPRREDLSSAVATYGWRAGALGAVRVSDGQACDDAGPMLLGLPGSQYGPLGIYVGRRYTIQRYSSATGEALTDRPTLAELPECDPQNCERIVAVAGDGRGRFVAIWERRSPAPDGGAEYQLSAQLFGREGRERSARIAVTEAASQGAELPAAALTANGTLVVTWQRTTGAAATSGLFLRTFQLP